MLLRGALGLDDQIGGAEQHIGKPSCSTKIPASGRSAMPAPHANQASDQVLAEMEDIQKEKQLPATPTASATGIREANMRKLLRRMVEKGEIVSPEYGKYTLPGTPQ